MKTDTIEDRVDQAIEQALEDWKSVCQLALRPVSPPHECVLRDVPKFASEWSKTPRAYRFLVRPPSSADPKHLSKTNTRLERNNLARKWSRIWYHVGYIIHLWRWMRGTAISLDIRIHGLDQPITEVSDWSSMVASGQRYLSCADRPKAMLLAKNLRRMDAHVREIMRRIE